MIYNSEYLDAHNEKVLMASIIKLLSDFQNLRNKVTFEKAELEPKQRNSYFFEFCSVMEGEEYLKKNP